MPSIVESVARSSGRPGTRILRRRGAAARVLGLVLAVVFPASACVGASPSELAAPQRAGAAWWRACRHPAIPSPDQPVEGERADVTAAQARLEAARKNAGEREGGGGLDLRALFGRTSRGLNNLVRSGGDLGQAELASPLPAVDSAAWRARRDEYEAARSAWRRTLRQACREAADAAAAADALTMREAQARASLADAEAAVAALRRGAGPAAASDPAVELAEREAAFRRARLLEVSQLAHAARGKLAQVLQAGGPP